MGEVWARAIAPIVHLVKGSFGVHWIVGIIVILVGLAIVGKIPQLSIAAFAGYFAYQGFTTRHWTSAIIGVIFAIAALGSREGVQAIKKFNKPGAERTLS